MSKVQARGPGTVCSNKNSAIANVQSVQGAAEKPTVAPRTSKIKNSYRSTEKIKLKTDLEGVCTFISISFILSTSSLRNSSVHLLQILHP